MARKKIDPELIAREFSAASPVGTPCIYFPVLPCDRSKEFERTAIRSEAWVLGHGAVVVKVDGRTGGVDIRHIAFGK